MSSCRSSAAFAACLAAWLLRSEAALAQNAIVAENQLPGTPPSEWQIEAAGDSSIQGFASDISVDRGETIHFEIDADTGDYAVPIYRMGWYGGNGARLVASATRLPHAFQPECLADVPTGLIDCGNWSVSASWAVPANAVSGIYFARPTRNDGEGASHIVFVVRDDAGDSDLLVQTSDATWQAYNHYGGIGFYDGPPPHGRGFKVSYNRPVLTRDGSGGQRSANFVFNAEYPLVRWLERNGYDVSYTTNVDTERRGQLIERHKIFVSVGHDEYWSAGMRKKVEAARSAGVHLAFLSGNEVFWKTRWESSIDGTSTPHRTLVCYKETSEGAKIDPLPEVWTGTWRDPRFSPPADGGRPENRLSGTLFTVDAYRDDTLRVPAEYASLRFWRNTEVATLAPGAYVEFGPGMLGHEWDEDLDNGFRPPGLFHLSSTTHFVPRRIQDYGQTFLPGDATHHLTLYRHASGALVFGAGTVQWAWGLDANHDTFYGGPGPPAEPAMQQATVNLFADMGNVQPATLQPGLVPATQTTDSLAPTSAVTFPLEPVELQAGVPMSIAGVAFDAGGGVVAMVEVSVDGGVSWQRAQATGSNDWFYSWTPAATGPGDFRSRAVDDSGNLEALPTEIPALGRALPLLALLLSLVGWWRLRGARKD